VPTKHLKPVKALKLLRFRPGFLRFCPDATKHLKPVKALKLTSVIGKVDI
jgi:hypothetical protein